MPQLIRKINRAKWFQIDIQNDNDVSADAITNCLKTKGNTLSFWNIENEDDLDKAVLAMVAQQERLDTIDVVVLDYSLFDDSEINIVVTPGDTPVKTLIDTHRDLECLTYNKLGIVKDLIANCIRTDKHKRYTITSLRKILNEAIEQDLIKKEDLILKM